MIDYFFRWATSSDARADAFAAAQHFGIQSSSGAWLWAQDHVLPNVQAWRPSQDTITVSSFSSVGTVVTHNYLTGWFAIVSLNRTVAVLINSSELAFALDRDGPPYVVRNNIGTIISDVACAPIFAGSHYPIGGYSS